MTDYFRIGPNAPGGVVLWLAGEEWLDEVGHPEMQRPICQANAAQCSRGILRQDYGKSWTVARDASVLETLEARQGNTLLLFGSAILLALLGAIPIGVLSASRPASGGAFAFFNLPFPVFWVSLLLIVCFGGSQSLWHRWSGLPFLPTGNMLLLKEPIEGSLLALLGAGWEIQGSWLDRAIHLILPTLALSAAPIVQWSRALHEALSAALRHDSQRTARGKGLSARAALYRHALRNAWLPFLAEIHRSLPALFSALLLVEVAFGWPGMGQLFVRALGASDFPLAIGFLLLSAELLLATSLLKDALTFLLDPRRRDLSRPPA